MYLPEARLSGWRPISADVMPTAPLRYPRVDERENLINALGNERCLPRTFGEAIIGALGGRAP